MKKDKRKFRRATKKEINGTSRIGTVIESFEQIKKILGEPHDATVEGEWHSRDKKIRVIWALVSNTNKKDVITIYDYKNDKPLDKIERWSLGGNIKGSNLRDIAIYLNQRGISLELWPMMGWDDEDIKEYKKGIEKVKS
jgi:hypothetical protein